MVNSFNEQNLDVTEDLSSNAELSDATSSFLDWLWGAMSASSSSIEDVDVSISSLDDAEGNSDWEATSIDDWEAVLDTSDSIQSSENSEWIDDVVRTLNEWWDIKSLNLTDLFNSLSEIWWNNEWTFLSKLFASLSAFWINFEKKAWDLNDYHKSLIDLVSNNEELNQIVTSFNWNLFRDRMYPLNQSIDFKSWEWDHMLLWKYALSVLELKNIWADLFEDDWSTISDQKLNAFLWSEDIQDTLINTNIRNVWHSLLSNNNLNSNITSSQDFYNLMSVWVKNWTENFQKYIDRPSDFSSSISLVNNLWRNNSNS